MKRGLALVGLAIALTATPGEARPLRVLSLDQCADQYALSLAPEADLFLSPRADDPDSHMAEAAQGRPRVRATLEAAVGVRPDVVVRYWGGDPRLLAALERRGVRVLTLDDTSDFKGIRADIRKIAAGLGRRERGETVVSHMDRTLAEAFAPPGVDRTALYLTAGGFTAGSGTLMDAILAAAGFANLAGMAGFGPVSVERIAIDPPRRFVLGFFDQVRSDWRGIGRHPVIRAASKGRVAADLPAEFLTCPAWFAADAALMVAQGGSRAGRP